MFHVPFFLATRMIRLLCFTAIIFALVSSCAPKADFDIRGEWQYTLISIDDGNTYDAGTIIFGGKPARGTYRQVNIYEVEYEGEYTVNASALQLTGSENWQGTLSDADTISGSWNHTDGASGMFTA